MSHFIRSSGSTSAPIAHRLLRSGGKNDPFFLPAGAEAYRRDNPSAKVVFYDAGHFALETHAAEIGAEIRAFLGAISKD
jgi:pimeloyl-ACP methyl ester carboxylesterase